MEYKIAHIWLLDKLENFRNNPARITPDGVCFVLSGNLQRELQAIAQRVFLQQEHLPFCVAFENVSGLATSGDVEYMSLLCSHPLYLVREQSPVVLSTGTNAAAAGTYLADLGTRLGHQGFQPPGIINYNQAGITLEPKYGFAVLNGISNPQVNDLEGLFEEWLVEHGSGLTLFAGGTVLASQCMDATAKVSKLLEHQKPDVYGLVRKNAELVRVANTALAKNRVLITALKSKTDYLDFLLNRTEGGETNMSLSEVSKIMKFYNNEYEVLPTWYKRFGHIIKVLTGKRTFRSLFNDNVKKYKD